MIAPITSLVLSTLMLSACSMNPHFEIGIGESLHDNYGWNQGTIGFISTGVAPFKDLPYFRVQAKHLSDPTTFSDAGITWVEGSVRFE